MAADLPPDGTGRGDDADAGDGRDDDGHRDGRGEAGATDRDAGSDGEQRCDLCGAPMLEWHCRIICTYCGYQRDCSDP